MHRWILSHALIPLAIHHAYVSYMGKLMGPISTFFVYTTSTLLTMFDGAHLFRNLAYSYGVLDGDKCQRDDVPGCGVRTLFDSFFLSTISRIMLIFLSYPIDETPASMNLVWLPIEISLYGIIYDFWFYWYHRLLHEVDGLWQYHRTHHLTKHPNVLLTTYFSLEEGVFSTLACPFLSWSSLKFMGLPMGLSEWWICNSYITFTEFAGHSGVRVYGSSPSPLTWLLRHFDAEIIIEDHDLHHRNGWRKSGNYGKHTRLWDRIFGTCYARIECLERNIDYSNQVNLPLISIPFRSHFVSTKLVKNDWPKRGRAQVDPDGTE
ncbi:hypothetical protein PISL3812_03031 [Talaromyces islandicus]|uniref:Fatty acid hydroxylase domain-containing protein n=1 Tax=Talaromyces islandicus TaxID=28573 RepID=A0A0U1LRN3_TALIS|nr:hypothetical protein PISL3812_03031 [Talaromyces islandicus]